jgi:NTE family protein
VIAARALGALALLAASSGCATHFVNEKLTTGEINVERRSIEPSDSRPIIVVSFSGGGSRAAALGWNVLKELREIRYQDGVQPRSLLDDVRVVSSVSGGSTIAAWFGLHGPGALDGFEPFLVKDNVQGLVWASLNPFAWLGHWFRGGSRTDFVVSMFEDELYHGKKMSELNKPGKPFVILNTTDMAGGEIFSFRPDMFNAICSDLEAMPISIAVATSADVPIVFAPTAMRNYSATDCPWSQPPAWVQMKLRSTYEPYLNLPVYRDARYLSDLHRTFDEYRFRDIQYLYLVDGGLADNSGGHSLLSTVQSPSDPAGILRLLNRRQVKRLVIIMVNAQSDPVPGEYKSADRPGILSMFDSVTGVPINSATAGSIGQVNDALAQIYQFATQQGAQVFNVLVDFDQFRVPEQAKLRDQVKAVPTSWTISAQDREVLKESATALLHQHPCFQNLLIQLGVDAPYIDKNFAMTACPQPK